MKIDIKSLEASAKEYKPRNRPWSQEEVDVIKRFYRKIPVRIIAEKLGRSVPSVQNKANEI